MSAQDEPNEGAETPEAVPASAQAAGTPAEIGSVSEETVAGSSEAEAVPEEAPKRSRRRRAAKPAAADEAEEPKAEKPAAKKPAADEAEEPAGKKPAAKKPAANGPAAHPRRSRSARKPSEPLPVVRAQARYVRSSARKARLVCDHIRGRSVPDARAILAHTTRAVARDWSKLLESAVANAEHNHELLGDDLYIKDVRADEGPTIKRFQPRARGRANRIRKRTSHLTILLTSKD